MPLVDSSHAWSHFAEENFGHRCTLDLRGADQSDMGLTSPLHGPKPRVFLVRLQSSGDIDLPGPELKDSKDLDSHGMTRPMLHAEVLLQWHSFFNPFQVFHSPHLDTFLGSVNHLILDWICSNFKLVPQRHAGRARQVRLDRKRQCQCSKPGVASKHTHGDHQCED